MPITKTLFCLLIIVCFVANFPVLPQSYAQKPKINATVTPKREINKPKSEAAKGKTSEENQPAISIEERMFDAGEVWEGDTVVHSFIVKNTGKGVLNISNVKPG